MEKAKNKLIYSLIKNKVRPFELALLFKKIFRVKRLVLERDNMRFYIDPVSDLGYKLMNEGEYEPKMTSTIKSLLNENSVFIDLGANEGYFSVIASSIIKTGKIYCIEPQERLWEVILQNQLVNNKTNWQIIPYAISTEEGVAEISLAPSLNSGSSSLIKGFSFAGSRKIGKKLRNLYWERQQVKLMPLDKILLENNINHADLIKIDIEGFELNAIRSCMQSIQKKIIKNFLIEIHPLQLKALNQNVSELENIFEQNNYIKTVIHENLLLFSVSNNF